MKKNILVSFIVVMLCVTLFGCGNDKKEAKKDPIIGKWAQGSYVYTFNEDKTCSYDAAGTLMNCTYEINGDKISILYTGSTAPFETTFSIEGNKLNVKDSLGRDTIYEKK